MNIGIIAALDEDNIIGNEGRIPWHIPEDLEHYRDTVEGKVVISGRITFEETPGNYQGEEHIVLSRRDSWSHKSEKVHHASDVEESINIANILTDNEETVFVIGGGNIYDEFVDIADRMILSHIEGIHEGDTYFPDFSDSEWTVTDVQRYDSFTIREYQR